jgi:hypothetical protein
MCSICYVRLSLLFIILSKTENIFLGVWLRKVHLVIHLELHICSPCVTHFFLVKDHDSLPYRKLYRPMCILRIPSNRPIYARRCLKQRIPFSDIKAGGPFSDQCALSVSYFLWLRLLGFEVPPHTVTITSVSPYTKRKVYEASRRLMICWLW